MIHVAAMAGLGAVEAVAYLWRYRSANEPCPYKSAASSGVIQLLRVSGIGGVAFAIDSGHWLWPSVAYVVSPVVVTFFAHKAMSKKRGAQ